MKSLLFLSMPDPLMFGVLVLTSVVILYSVAKGIMRYMDKNRKDK